MPDLKKENSVARLKVYILVLIILLLVITSLVLHSKGVGMGKIKLLKELTYFPLIYILAYVFASFVPMPFVPFTFIGASIFPFWKAFIYSFIGYLLFAVLMFYLTRWLGRDFVKNYETKNKRLKALDLKLEKNAFGDVILLRFFFLIPPELICIVAGLSSMKFKDYFIATIIGSIPILFASVALVKGEQIGSNLLFATSIILFAIMFIIPLIAISNLRNFFKRDCKPPACRRF